MRYNLTLATATAATTIATIAICALTPVAGFSAQRAGGGGGGGGGSPHSGGGGGGGAHFVGGGGGHLSAAHSGGGGHFAHYATPRAGGNFRAVHSANPGASVNTRAAHNVNIERNPNVGTTRSANPELNIKSAAVHDALNSRAVAGTPRNAGALHDPHARALIAANAATAGWRHGGDNGWWRHRNGGFGWVGPLFWPFAYYDIYDYALWGYGYDPSFWGYGYDDIYAGMFAPYGYRNLTGYPPRYASRNTGGSRQATPAPTPGPLAQMCGEDSRDIAGLPVDKFQQAIQPDDAQRVTLDDLANASVKAAQDIKAACPSEIALTAPGRLAAMQSRIEAMTAAVATVQPALEKFYGLLTDEQKERITALGQEQRRGRNAGTLDQSCTSTPASVTDWPVADIERTVRPTEAQRAGLTALQDAGAKAADMLKTACPADEPLTPPARLAAVGQRLDTLLQAVKTVSAPLNDFYGMLDDEQKARFNAIAPAPTSQADQAKIRQTSLHRHGFPSIGGFIRHILRFF
jgi:LTXXQ motif family protein